MGFIDSNRVYNYSETGFFYNLGELERVESSKYYFLIIDSC